MRLLTNRRTVELRKARGLRIPQNEYREGQCRFLSDDGHYCCQAIDYRHYCFEHALIMYRWRHMAKLKELPASLIDIVKRMNAELDKRGEKETSD